MIDFGAEIDNSLRAASIESLVTEMHTDTALHVQVPEEIASADINFACGAYSHPKGYDDVDSDGLRVSCTDMLFNVAAYDKLDLVVFFAAVRRLLNEATKPIDNVYFHRGDQRGFSRFNLLTAALILLLLAFAIAPLTGTQRATPTPAPAQPAVQPCDTDSDCEKKAPKPAAREVFYCGALTKAGTPCRHRVKAKGDHCWQHQKA